MIFLAKLYPYKIEQTDQIKNLYKKESSPKREVKQPDMFSTNADSLKLKLITENILQGIIFSEVFGKPKGMRMRRR